MAQPPLDHPVAANVVQAATAAQWTGYRITSGAPNRTPRRSLQRIRVHVACLLPPVRTLTTPFSGSRTRTSTCAPTHAHPHSPSPVATRLTAANRNNISEVGFRSRRRCVTASHFMRWQARAVETLVQRRERIDTETPRTGRLARRVGGCRGSRGGAAGAIHSRRSAIYRDTLFIETRYL